MYNIVVNNIHSHIEPRLPGDIIVKINNDLRYRPAGYQHTYYFKLKKWDGYNYLFDSVDQKFRTGLVWRICNRFERENISYTIHDLRSKPIVIKDLENIDLGSIQPFDYQIEAAKATLKDTHSVVASPTGTGKTVMMQLMTRLHRTKTLIVVNSRTLLDQTFEAFNEVVPGGAGIIGSGDFEPKDVTIATIQSLATILRLSKKQQKKAKSWKEEALREWLSDLGLVIHDEVHEADNKQVDAFYGQINASRYIGMTATPFEWAHATEKGKNLEMEQHFGRKVFDSRGEVDFIKLGITVPLYIQRIVTPSAKQYIGWTPGKKHPYEYKDVVQNQIIDNELRIKKIAEMASSMVRTGKSCYVYYNRIAYGESLCEAMSDLDPVMLQGKTSRHQRNKIFKEIDDKKRLLVVSDIGSYGLNIKSLDSILIASPVKDARQLKGRVCRASDGKDHGLVIDPVDYTPFLYKHSGLRLNQYNSDQDVVIG